MTQLVILVVAAAWLAVLIPPMLRSRVENRPNSSVTDFRRQLDKLQHTAGPRPAVRAMGRPLAPTGLGRSARVARTERPVLRSGVTVPQRVDGDRRPDLDDTRVADSRVADPRTTDMRTTERREPVRTGGGRYRSHGDPTGGSARPDFDTEPANRSPRPAERREVSRERREHTAPRGMGRPVDTARRRRTNVLLLLIATTASTLFLAATTGSSAMFYAFALSFLALMGYVYLLAQTTQRPAPRDDGWFERY